MMLKSLVYLGALCLFAQCYFYVDINHHFSGTISSYHDWILHQDLQTNLSIYLIKVKLQILN